MQEKILIVDDDPHIREIIVFAVKKAGMQAIEATNGHEAITCSKKHYPDLIILDINLPEEDGFDVCKTIRKTADTPILFLSSRDEEVDRIIGLEIGGDDYVTKPFSPRELIARIKVILKRSRKTSIAQQKIFTHGLLELEPESYQVRWNGQAIELTSTEFAILKGMINHLEMVYSRDKIMNLAYDSNVYISDRTIDSHIRHIRQKFSDVNCGTVFKTVHGVGYKIGSCL